MLTKIKFIILTLLNSFNDIYTLQFSTLKMTRYNKHNKFISLYPAGINGFYTLGIASYIFDHYQTQEYNYIGASSGSWNSLICCYKYNKTDLVFALQSLLDQAALLKSHTIKLENITVESKMKLMLEELKSRDFISLPELIKKGESKLAVSVILVAALELNRKGYIEIVQGESYGEVYFKSSEEVVH